MLLVAHTGRADIVELARSVIRRVADAGIVVRVLAGEAGDLAADGVVPVAENDLAADGAELVLVLGGDGTLLRAAALARPSGAGLLGVNLGRVGFLAETEPETLDDTITHVIDADYQTEQRLTLDVTVTYPDGTRTVDWALNEASIEKAAGERIVQVSLEIDGRPVMSFGGDGVLIATPTGSTAYAFSAGGPVAWPGVQALIVVPNNAHAVFTRPLVTTADADLVVRVSPDGQHAELRCDGSRATQVPAGSTVRIRRGDQQVKVVRVHHKPFSDRLVAKFALPVQGFRDRRR